MENLCKEWISILILCLSSIKSILHKKFYKKFRGLISAKPDISLGPRASSALTCILNRYEIPNTILLTKDYEIINIFEGKTHILVILFQL